MPIDARALAEVLASLGALEPPEHATEAALERTVEAAGLALGADGAGLSALGEGGLLRQVAATAGPGQRFEQLERESGEGPSVDAFFHARLVESEDLAADGRWPRLGPLAAAAGVRAVLAAPVGLAGGPLGTLHVHVAQPRRWTDHDRAAVQAEAGALAAVLQQAASSQARAGVIEQLEHALRHRVVIEQAKGVLRERDGLPPDEAFEQLRRAARTSRRTTAEVAQDVLDGQRLS
jgi:GAF domain-containing protein